jgi:hypothetical protein
MLSIVTVKTETRDRYVLVKVTLENQGESVVGPGTMLGRQTSTGGAIRLVEFRNSTNIPPGCTAKVSQLLSAMRELEFTGYRQNDGVIIPFSGGMVKRLSFLRSVAGVTARWWDEVLLPRSTSIVARFRVLLGNAWILAEVPKRVKDRAQAVGNALGSLGAGIVQRCGRVLVPRQSSIAARFRALRGNAWMRLEIDKRVNHGAEVAAKACLSINAELVRWRDEVLLPRTRSIGSRFKALHKNGWLRLADAKQRREHRARMERQAWEAADADILRWRDEVLLPRTRSIAARFKAFHKNGWFRRADAKQRRMHRAQMEREAWEAVDADILRWWGEVVLPRSRSIAARTKETLGHSKWIRVAKEIRRRVESYRTRRS